MAGHRQRPNCASPRRVLPNQDRPRRPGGQRTPVRHNIKPERCEFFASKSDQPQSYVTSHPRKAPFANICFRGRTDANARSHAGPAGWLGPGLRCESGLKPNLFFHLGRNGLRHRPIIMPVLRTDQNFEELIPGSHRNGIGRNRGVVGRPGSQHGGSLQ